MAMLFFENGLGRWYLACVAGGYVGVWLPPAEQWKWAAKPQEEWLNLFFLQLCRLFLRLHRRPPNPNKTITYTG